MTRAIAVRGSIVIYDSLIPEGGRGEGEIEQQAGQGGGDQHKAVTSRQEKEHFRG